VSRHEQKCSTVASNFSRRKVGNLAYQRSIVLDAVVRIDVCSTQRLGVVQDVRVVAKNIGAERRREARRGTDLGSSKMDSKSVGGYFPGNETCELTCLYHGRTDVPWLTFSMGVGYK